MSADFGQHRVVRELARGGMGVLYEVEHLPTGARRALKTLLLGAHDPEERARFRREAELLARLDHPAVVRVHEAVTDGPAPYLVQELLPGGSLEARLAKGPLPCEQARAIAAALARGLEHAHARGVLHRDLKPRNVVFDGEGRPCLVDFGLARRVERGSLTAEGTILGTPGYLPPEQALGRRADERSDVYGLGAVLYAMLVGRPPFEGAHALAVLAAVAEGNVVPPRRLRPDVPPDLEALCLRALATDPAARFPTASALAGALEGRGPAPAAGRPSPLLLGLGAALLLGALGGALWLRSRGSGPPVPAPPTPAPARVAPAPPRATEPSPAPRPTPTGLDAAVELLARCEVGQAVAALSAAVGSSINPVGDPERGPLDALARSIDDHDGRSLVLGREAVRLLRALAPLEEVARGYEAMADLEVFPRERFTPARDPLALAESALVALQELEQVRPVDRRRWREAIRRRAQRTIGRALAAHGLAQMKELREGVVAFCEEKVRPLGPERDHTDVLWSFHQDMSRRAVVLARLAAVGEVRSIHRQALDVIRLVSRQPIDLEAGEALVRALDNLILDNGGRLLATNREVGRLHRLAAYRLRRARPDAPDGPDVLEHLRRAKELIVNSGEEGGGESGEQLFLTHLAGPDLPAAARLLPDLHDVSHPGLLEAELHLARRDWAAARRVLEGVAERTQERQALLAHALRLEGVAAWEAPLDGAEAHPAVGIEWRSLADARDVANDRAWWPGLGAD